MVLRWLVRMVADVLLFARKHADDVHGIALCGVSMSIDFQGLLESQSLGPPVTTAL